MSDPRLRPPVAWETRTLPLDTHAGLRAEVRDVLTVGGVIYVLQCFVNVEDELNSSGVLLAYDSVTRALIKRLNIGQQPRRLAFNTRLNHLYIAHSVVENDDARPVITVLDRAKLTLVRRLDLVEHVTHLAVNSPLLKIYAANASTGQIQVINADTFASLPAIALKPGLQDLVVDAPTSRIYATIAQASANPPVSEIVVLTASTGQIAQVATFDPQRFRLGQLLVNSTNDRLYAINHEPVSQASVLVLDRSLNVVATLPMPDDARALAVNGALNQLYVATNKGLEILDTTAHQPVTTIAAEQTLDLLAFNGVTRQLYGGGLPGDQLLIATPIATSPFDLTLLRPDDLLHLDLEFVNLKVQIGAGGAAQLVRETANQPALVIVHLPPQSLAEETFDEPGGTVRLPARARLAKASRLAFKLPDALSALPYTIDGLLDWSKLEPLVAPTALPQDTNAPVPPPPIVEPSPQQTAIEMPYRMILSPDRTAGWQHARRTISHAGYAELWHTRLESQPGVLNDPTLRAVWSPDIANPNAQNPFPTTLEPDHRRQLVRLTSDWSLAEQPRPLQVDQFMLTSQGAWMRTRGRWEPSAAAGLTIQEWRHNATQGRDHYVRVVERGYIYPFGHRAVHITISERKIQTVPKPGGGTQTVAALRKRQYIVITEPNKRYEETSDAFKHAAREMPLSQGLRIATTVTPLLDSPSPQSQIGLTGAFWVRANGGDVPFHFVATDVEGQESEFSTALIFIPADKIGDTNVIKAVNTAYTFLPPGVPESSARRAAHVPGQQIALAPSASSGARAGTPGDGTSLTIERLLFNTAAPIKALDGGLSFLPNLERAAARVPAVEQLSGVAQSVNIKLFTEYLNNGFAGAQNQAQVFAELIDQLPIDLPNEKAGGIAAMAMSYSGLSRSIGPVAGNLQNAAKGLFNPAEIFGALGDSKLLGYVSLKDLIKQIVDVGQFPKTLTETIKSAQANVPDRVVTRLDWKPRVNSVGPLRITEPNTPGQPATELTIKATFEQVLAPGAEPSYQIVGTLTNFTIDFLGVVLVHFQQLKFVSEKGKKLDVIADLRQPSSPSAPPAVEFAGALAFLNELRKYIPFDGFSDPPSLDVSPRGVDVGYSLGLPPLAVGVFALQNVTLGAALHLPFVDEPARLRFNFSERHKPFQITVSMFGGGGFFALDMALDRILLLEAAIEFGGSISINLGVASGGVYVMAGIYFKLAENPATGKDEAELSGYLRAGGALKVLGLICVSVEFYMGLTYLPAKGKVHGQASLKVKVSIAFFSKTVTLKVERSFGGSSGDPTFGQLMDAEDWQSYAEAFA
ncbi:MAG: hypothetical protein JOZ51_24705 [Chloroflexi bacterium]|nr:hypothetical protein [Chloroflexota bacterium]